MGARRFFIYVLLVLLPLQSMATERARAYMELSMFTNGVSIEHGGHHGYDIQQTLIHEGHQERNASVPSQSRDEPQQNYGACDGCTVCVCITLLAAASLVAPPFPRDDRMESPYPFVNLNYSSHIPEGLLRPPRIFA